MITLEIRQLQLAHLTETLGDLLAILRQDHHCEWTARFEGFLGTAQQLAGRAFAQAELDEFSRSICRIFDPTGGSFCEYRPPAKLLSGGLHGTANFETFTRATYERALQLRVVDR